MAPTPVYSTLLSCIYDEPAPIGRIGRGTHYSVFRCAEWRDVNWSPVEIAQVHDFAVIWDEDHDTRVIEVAEALYAKGLFAPVQFIGERKGSLSIILAAKFLYNGPVALVDEYRKKLVGAVEAATEDDYWPLEIGVFDRASGSPFPHQSDLVSIIHDSEHRVDTYLRNVDSLWSLGTKPYSASVTRSANAPT
jgi:hypothetical protein